MRKVLFQCRLQTHAPGSLPMFPSLLQASLAIYSSTKSKGTIASNAKHSWKLLINIVSMYRSAKGEMNMQGKQIAPQTPFRDQHHAFRNAIHAGYTQTIHQQSSRLFPPPKRGVLRRVLRSHPPPRRSRPLHPCRTGSDRPHHPHPSAHQSREEQRPREPAFVCQ
jgi:hypothetical protein